MKLCKLALTIFLSLALFSPTQAIARVKTVQIHQSGTANDVDANITGGTLNVDVLSQPTMTHMGQSPNDHVMLFKESADGACSRSNNLANTFIKRVPLGGGEAREDFVVPAGRILVITDFHAIVEASEAFTNEEVQLDVRVASNFITLARVRLSSGDADADRVAIKANSISGILVGAGNKPCLRAVLFTGGPISGGSLRAIPSASLQGYLIDAPALTDPIPLP